MKDMVSVTEFLHQQCVRSNEPVDADAIERCFRVFGRMCNGEVLMQALTAEDMPFRAFSLALMRSEDLIHIFDFTKVQQKVALEEMLVEIITEHSTRQWQAAKFLLGCINPDKWGEKVEVRTSDLTLDPEGLQKIRAKLDQYKKVGR
jgi:hypothetical protein